MDFFGKKYDSLPGDDKKRQIKKNWQEIDSWEGYLSSDDQVLSKQRDISEIVPTRNFGNLNIIYLVCFLLCVILAGRLWQLQIVQGKESLEKAEGNILHVETVYAPRGVIYDRNRNILAGNKSRYDLTVIPAHMSQDVEKRYDCYLQISQILGKDSSEIRAIVEEKGINNWNEVKVVKDLEREKALILKTKQLPGFEVENISSRKYYCDEQCAHVLGYTGQVSENELLADAEYQPIDQVGRAGLESYYERELKGTNGAEYRIVDASGETINVLTPREGVSGNNIVTALDMDLQKLAFEEISSQIGRGNTTGGSVVVSNPNTGEIIALVSAPAYSSEKMSAGLTEEEYANLLNNDKLPLFNRPITGEYPPGSTFKIVSATGILSEGLADIYDYVNDQGTIRVVNKYDPNIIYYFYSWDRSGLGSVNIIGALEKSSDIYFYVYGGGWEDIEGLGIERIKEYSERFMISKTLGIDIEGERPGFIPTPEWKYKTFGEDWYLGDDYNTIIGQGSIQATPLQVNAYTAAIANGGKIYRPHIVNEVIDSTGNVINRIKPEIIKQDIALPEVIGIIRQGLEAVVNTGTAGIMKNAIVSVAGKTGTAQYENNTKEHAWFTCYAPVDNPQIAVTVMVEGGGEGSSVAVPIALKLVNEYFREE